MDEEEFQAMLRYQNMLSRQVLSDIKTNGKIKVLEIINELSLSSRKKLQTAAILDEAENRGMLAQDVYAIIDDLIKDRMIEEKDGVIKKR